MTIAKNISLRLLVATAFCGFFITRPSTQAPTAADGPWGGWVRCEVTAQAEGYTDQQVHTWIMSSGTPRAEGALRVFPATWSVVGVGSLQRATGGNTVTAQWAANGQTAGALIAVSTRGEGRLVFALRHPQLRATRGFTGYRFYTVDGKRQSAEQFGLDVEEYRFAAIDAAPGNVVSGSGAVSGRPSTAFLPQPGSTGSVSCTWRFGIGAASPQPPALIQAVATPKPPPPGSTPDPLAPIEVAIAPGRAIGGPSSTPTSIEAPPARATAGPSQSSTLDGISDPNRAATVISGPPLDPNAAPTGSPSSASNDTTSRAAVSGYRVTATQLTSGRPSRDDPFQPSGNGDEVFAAAVVRRFDRRSGEILEANAVRTGDFTGVKPLDKISNFSWTVWDGPLRDGIDVLMISPTIWEDDGNPTAFVGWAAYQQARSPSLLQNSKIQGQITSKSLGSLLLDPVPINVTFVPGNDRPFGLTSINRISNSWQRTHGCTTKCCSTRSTNSNCFRSILRRSAAFPPS